LGRVVRAIEDYYRKKGYGLVRVIIPEQTVANQEIFLEIIEGFIERVEVQGAKNLGRLKGYVDNILREVPLRFSSLERNFLLMNEVAGYQIKTGLKPGTKRGGVVLVLDITRKPITGFFEVNNWGTETVGLVKLQSGVFLNSLGEKGERITLSGAVSLFDIKVFLMAVSFNSSDYCFTSGGGSKPG
jgi:hemolysin activation/secretion protein